ncbi:hypothetical protein [Halobaculum gomorrense]|uniref:DUF7123 domain-containing protein n=1 Tax=Halobaculum gomorrense TaxID=43928 RepID=A0A1M5S4L5_9EURY|nr:hypothetical protein [Halobaculum gomorrense]SHH32903.1 hypothetical protein SAMN05443636_2321 [Halobaculum gomorrense]
MVGTEADRREIVQYLINKLDREGEFFTRSKYIGSELGMSPHKVGAEIGQIDWESQEVELEAWSKSRCATWLVKKSS